MREESERKEVKERKSLTEEGKITSKQTMVDPNAATLGKVSLDLATASAMDKTRFMRIPLAVTVNSLTMLARMLHLEGRRRLKLLKNACKPGKRTALVSSSASQRPFIVSQISRKRRTEFLLTVIYL